MGFCGYKCEFCPAFRATKENNAEELQRCASEWSRLLGLEITPGMLKCDGCYHEQGRKFRPDCEIRRCARGKGIVTCAECGDYACDGMRARFVLRSEIEARLAAPVEEEVYEKYIKPLENQARLNIIHKRFAK